MKELTYETFDKSDWGDGPWMDEPDKMQWQDGETGLPCLAVRNHFGSWCGYVGVSPDHPAYGLGYDDVRTASGDWPDVHGGLTYAGHCRDGDEATNICHVPEPGEPDKVFWFGFDCNHWRDFAPEMHARTRKMGGPFEDEDYDHEKALANAGSPTEGVSGVYKDLGYVRAEVAQLAKQLAELA